MISKLLVFAGSTILLSLAARTGRSQEVDLRSRLDCKVYRDGGGQKLPYRIFAPKGLEAGKRYPLVVFLHGAGERGDDNQAQLKHAEVLRLVRDDVQATHRCFVVAPQCPKDRKWVEVPWSSKEPHAAPAEPSQPMRLLLGLLDEVAKKYPIDPSRRYATGISMGGFGTLDLVVRRPKDFAAAVPVCGGADNARVAALAGKVSFWIFHGGADGVVPTVRSRSLVEALKAAGGKPRYTEYPGVGHNSWTKAYQEPELVEWLFAQCRGGK